MIVGTLKFAVADEPVDKLILGVVKISVLELVKAVVLEGTKVLILGVLILEVLILEGLILDRLVLDVLVLVLELDKAGIEFDFNKDLGVTAMSEIVIVLAAPVMLRVTPIL